MLFQHSNEHTQKKIKICEIERKIINKFVLNEDS